MKCPNKASVEWKELVTKIGEFEAYREYIANGEEIPNPSLYEVGSIKLKTVDFSSEIPSDISIVDGFNIAEREHVNRVLSRLALYKVTELRGRTIADVLEANTSDVKDYILGAINNTLTDVELASSLTASQKELIIKTVNNLKSYDSALWREFKQYFLNEYNIQLSDTTDFLDNEGNPIAELPSHWEDTGIFKENHADKVAYPIKFLIATTLKATQDSTQEEEIINRETLSGFGEPLDFKLTWNYLWSQFTGVTSKQQMMEVLLDRATNFDKSLFGIYNQLAENDNLQLAFYSSFRLQALKRHVNILTGFGEELVYSPRVNNLDAFPENAIINRWKNIINKNIERGVYNKFTLLKSEDLNFKKPDSIIAEIVRIADDLKIDLDANTLRIKFIEYNNDKDTIVRELITPLNIILTEINTHIEGNDRLGFDEGSSLTVFANIVKNFRYNIADGSSVTITDKLVYTPVLPNMLTDWFDKLHSSDPTVQTAFIDALVSIPKLQYSNWLWNTSSSATNPNGLLNFTFDGNTKVPNRKGISDLLYDVNSVFLERFRLYLFEGNSHLSSNTVQEYTDIENTDWDTTSLLNYIDNKMSPLSVSDSGHTNLIGIFKITIPQDKFNPTTSKVSRNSNAWRAVKNTFLQEREEYITAFNAFFTVINGKIEVRKGLDTSKLVIGKDWDGNSMLDSNDVPTGRVFKFLNMNIKHEGKVMDITEYTESVNAPLLLHGILLTNENGEVLIDDAQEEAIDSFIDEFITQQINANLGIFRDSKYLEYIKLHNRNSKYTITNWNRFIAEFTINNYVSNVEQAELLFGSKNEFKDITDANKRYNLVMKPGMVGDSNTTMTVATYNEYGLPAANLSTIKKLAPNLAFNYEHMTELSNAMSLMTYDMFKRIAKHFGRYEEYSDTFNRLDREEKINPLEIKTIIESLKHVYVNRDLQTIKAKDDPNAPSFTRLIQQVLKNSTLVLIPQYIQGSWLEDVHNFMVNTGTDQINSSETEKLGKTSTFDLVDKEGNLNSTIKSIARNNAEEEVLSFTSIYHKQLSLNNLRVQQDVKSAIVDHENKLAIQVVKVIFDNIVLNGTEEKDKYNLNGKLYTGKELFDEFMKLYTTNIREDRKALLKELDVREVDGKLIINTSKLDDILREYVNTSTSSENIKLALTETNGQPNMPVYATIDATKFLQVLTARFTNKIVRQMLPGSHAAIVANILMNKNNLHEEDVDTTGVKYVKEIEDAVSKGVRDYRLRSYTEDNGKITIAEVLISPWDSRFYKDGQLIDINDVNESVRTMIGYRIPAEAKNSMIVFKVVGFIETGASQIVLPDSLTVTAGLDYDLDTEYTIQYNTRLDTSDGQYKFTVVDYDTKSVTSRYERMYHPAFIEKLKNIIEQISNKEKLYIGDGNAETSLMEDIFNDKDLYELVVNDISSALQPDVDRITNKYNISRMSYEQLKTLYMSLSERLKDAPSIEEFAKLSIHEQNNRASRENRIIDIMKSILTDKKHFEEGQRPNKFTNIQFAVNRIKELASRTSNNMNIYTYKDNSEMRRMNLSSRELKGISVAYDSVLRILGLTRTVLRDDLGVTIKHEKSSLKYKTIKSLEKIVGKGNVKEEGDYFIITYKYVGNNLNGTWTNINNERISDQTAEVTSNILDFVKFQLGFNFNKDTIPVYRLFSAVGVAHLIENAEGKSVSNSHIYAEAFISQKVVTQLISEIKSGRGLFNNEPEFRAIEHTKIKYIQGLYEAFKRIDPKFKITSFEKNIEEGDPIWIDSPFKVGGNYDFINKILKNKVKSVIDKEYDLERNEPISLGELESYLKYDVDTEDDIERVNFIVDQLNVLENYKSKYQSAKAISETVNFLNTDKKGAGPTVDTTRGIRQSMLNSIADYKYIRETLFEKGVKKEVVKEVIHALKSQTTAIGINNILTDWQLDGVAAKLYINGIPLAEAIYPSTFDSTEESVYPSFEEFFISANLTSEKILSQYLLSETPVFRSFIDYIERGYKIRLTTKEVARIQDYLKNSFISQNVFFNQGDVANEQLERERVLGFIARPDKFIPNVNVNLDSIKSVAEFNALTLFEKLDLIYSNKRYQKYINHPDFHDLHILNLLDIRDSQSEEERVGRKYINFSFNGNSNYITHSFNDMWYSANPYLRSIAEDLIKYSFYTNGLSFGRNFSKIIPYNILFNDQDNNGIGYKNTIEDLFVKSKNIENYGEIVTPSFIDSLHRHFWKNKKLVPSVSKFRKSRKGKWYVKKGYPLWNVNKDGNIYEEVDRLERDNLDGYGYVSLWDKSTGLTTIYKYIGDTDGYRTFIPVSKLGVTEYGETIFPNNKLLVNTPTTGTVVQTKLFNEEVYGTIFEANSTTSYSDRNKLNVDETDITFAFAKDFTSRGEEATKYFAGKKYANIGFSSDKTKVKLGTKVSTVDIYISEGIDHVVDFMVRKLNAIGKDKVKINIAGNGIYSLTNLTQDKVNDYFTELFRKLKLRDDLNVEIEEVRSGGQTGIDEAGVIGARNNGYTTKVVTTKDWKFRIIEGNTTRDIANKDKFIARFNTDTINTLKLKQEITNEQVEALQAVRKLVTLNEKDHTYWYKGKELQSVSSIVKKTYPFEGDPDDFVVNSEIGKQVHSFVESVIKGKTFAQCVKEFKNADPKQLKGIYDIIKLTIDSATEDGSIIVSELIVANLDMNLAGTIDILLILPNGHVNIIDIKTSKHSTEHFYDKRTNPSWTYSKRDTHTLQLELYKRMLEKGDTELGVPKLIVDKLFILPIQIVIDEQNKRLTKATVALTIPLKDHPYYRDNVRKANEEFGVSVEDDIEINGIAEQDARNKLIEYLTNKIIAFKNLSLIYKDRNNSYTELIHNIANKYADDFRPRSEDDDSTTFDGIKQFQLDIIKLALESDLEFLKVSLNQFSKRLNDYNANTNFIELIKDKEKRIAFTTAMHAIGDFIRLFETIDLLEDLHKDDGSEEYKEVVSLVNELVSLKPEIKKIADKHKLLTNRFFIARTIQFSSNPKYKDYNRVPEFEDYDEELKAIDDLLNNNRDITQFMYYLDTTFETGVTFVDNLLKRYVISRGQQLEEVRKQRQVFDKEFIKAFGKRPSPTDSKRVAEWFKANFVERGSSRLITRYNYKIFSDEQKKFYLRLIDIKAEKDKVWIDYNAKKEDITANYTGKERYAKIGEITKIKQDLLSEINARIADEKANWYGTYEIKDDSKELNDNVANKQATLSSEKFTDFLDNNHIKEDKDTGVYYTSIPGEMYRNSDYDKLVDVKDGVEVAKTKEGEFYIYLKQLIVDLLSFDSAFIVHESFIPTLPDLDRTNLDSLLQFLGLSDQEYSTRQYVGLNNELVNYVELPLVKRLYKRQPIRLRKRMTNETKEVYESSILTDLTNLNLVNDLNLPFTTLDEVYIHNRLIKEENEKFHSESMSFDIYKVMQNFIAGATHHKYQLEFEDEMLLGLSTAKQMQFISETNKDTLIKNVTATLFKGEFTGHKISGEDSLTVKRLSEFISVQFYGNKVDSKTIERLIKPFIQLTSMRVMMGNVTAGVKNIAVGYAQMISESTGNYYCTLKDLKKGTGIYLKDVPWDIAATRGLPTAKTLAGGIIKLASDLLEKQDEKGNTYDKSIKNVLDRVLTASDALYIFNNSGEHFMQYSMLLTLMHSHKMYKGRAVGYHQFKEDNRKALVESLLNDTQKASLEAYIIKKTKAEEKKFDKSDYIGEWIRNSTIDGTLTKEQRVEFVKKVNAEDKRIKQEFDALPNVYDQFELIDGYAEIKEGSELTFDEWTEFKRKALTINQSMQGIYNQLDRNKLQYAIWGQALFQFRKWMVPTWNRFMGTRLFKSQWSETRNTEIKGAFDSLWEFIGHAKTKNPIGIFHKRDADVSVMQAFGNIIKDWTKFLLTARTQWHSLTDLDKSNIRKVAMHMTMLSSFACLIAIIGIMVGAGDDDDKKKRSMAYYIMMYELNGIYTELTSPVPVFGWYQNVKMFMDYPMAGEKTLVDLWKINYNLFTYPFRTEEERMYSSGAKKDQDRLVSSLKSMIPVYREFYKWQNIPSYVNFYKMYNPLAL